MGRHHILLPLHATDVKRIRTTLKREPTGRRRRKIRRID
jgi:hypothetical protein